jgi:hypothetical protein
MKSKPWDFRFTLRLPSSHSNCIYEVYIHYWLRASDGSRPSGLDLVLLEDFQRVVYLNAEVTDRIYWLLCRWSQKSAPRPNF